MASEVDTRRETDLSTYCTIKREPRRNRPPAILESPNRSAVLTKRYSGSSDDLYVGTRVSIVPEPEAYAIQVSLSVAVYRIAVIATCRSSYLATLANGKIQW